MNDSRLDPTMIAVLSRSLSILQTELVELGREAWRISERERAVRAEIEALQKIKENQ
jgi:hypothetical protein